jgi:hypothetical protein
MAVMRRQRPGAAPAAEPVKIPVKEIEPSANEEGDQEDQDDAERSGRAASSRTDYQAVCEKFTKGVTNRKSAIRAMCVTCMGGMLYEVAKCTSTGCPLYAYRMGENPNDARTIAAKAKKEAEAEVHATTHRKPAATGRTTRPVRRTARG